MAGRRKRKGTTSSGRSPLRPVDVDGVRTISIGTVLWSVAFLVLVFQRDSLEAQDREWWLWTCLAGAGLGLLGLEYCRHRRDAIERAQPPRGGRPGLAS